MRFIGLAALVMLGCGGPGTDSTDSTDTTTEPACDDCGAPSTCAEPFCDEASGTCDPGLLVQDLDDDVAGDCSVPTCDGTSPDAVVVADDTDLPPAPDPADPEEGPCGMAACTAGVPGIVPVAAGTECDTGFCSGLGTGEGSCQRCADTEPDVNEVDAGCTRERSACIVDAWFPNGGCVAPTVWDEDWGTATIGTDGLTVANLSDDVRANVRSTASVNAGTYYWEIRVVEGDPDSNDGGVGILTSRMESDLQFIGADDTGLSFGYPNNPFYFTGFPDVELAGVPPESSFTNTGYVYMFALDMDAGSLWLGVEGVWFHDGDPAKGLNPAITGLPDADIHAGVSLYTRHTTVFEGNFMGPFQFPVPEGFRAGLF